ncbi:neurexin-1-like [Dreissena polymorpha]|uniref:neurexin-1-like n=1 Tax=Dreissena polymorpha TaxID=45954 RepID=UPI002263D5A1|nr:neurexin-1-like [Dreissena polymorpha]
MAPLVSQFCSHCFMILVMIFIKVCGSFKFDGSSTSFGKFSQWTPCHNGTIEFEFRTNVSNALLFYIDSGDKQKNPDYFELKLIDGLMHLRFKLNREIDMVSSAMGNLNDNEWHLVKLMRVGRQTTLVVDKATIMKEHQNFDIEYKTFGDSVDNYVYIGGLPNIFNTQLEKLAQPHVKYEPRLRGSVRNLFYSNCGKEMTKPDLLDSQGLVLADDQCIRNNPCLNGGICVTRDRGMQCDCSATEFTGEFCQIEIQPLEVMFQGSQYLTYNLKKHGDPIFSSNDQLLMYFKTTQPDGLLFYTGENADHMTVFLKNGAVHVTMNLGSGSFNEVADMNGYKLDDGQWHLLQVSRKSREVSVDVDGSQRLMGMTQGTFTMLSSHVIYLGGSPNTDSLAGSDIRANFRGCMKKVVYKADSLSLDIIELANRGHEFIVAAGDIVYGQCQEVIDSQPVTFLTPESFIALPRWDVKNQNGSISFQFRTSESDGLLLYNSAEYGSNNLDFIAMEIIDGDFYLVLALGTGVIKEKVSRTKINDGMPHVVVFQYRGKTGYISVDSHEYEYVTPGMGKELDLQDMMYIGGLNFHRYNAYRLPKEVWSGILKQGYVGCMQDLKINNNKVDLMMVARKQQQKDVRNECRKLSDQCSEQVCMHRGSCVEGWNRYICDCRGTSYTGVNCEHAATTLSFDQSQYVMVTLPQETSTEAEDISLRFRTSQANGLLLMTHALMPGDSIELFLERGACKLTVTLGQRSKTLSVGHNLNDNAWHTAYIKRRGQAVWFWVDALRHVTDNIPLIAITLHVKQIVVGSMGPLLSGPAAFPSEEGVQGDMPVRTRDMPLRTRDLPLRTRDLPLRTHNFFVGDMQQFIYNGNQFFDMAKEKSVESIEVTARFDPGGSLIQDAVTFESQESYVTLPHHLLQSHTPHFSLSFKFKTRQNSGLILYSGLNGPDFLAMEIDDGYLYYIYDMGGGSKRVHVNTPEPLNDNNWHDVSLFRPQMDQQQIRVDSNPSTVEDMKGYSARHFDLKGPLYIGGLVKTRFNTLSTKISSRYGFLGCMAALDINSQRIDILDAANFVESSGSHTVTRGCTSSEVTCHSKSCENGGQCEQQWNFFVCNCDMTSFVGPHCTDESIAYKIGLNNGLIVFEYPGNSRPSTKSDYLALGITTIQDRAMILRIDSADTQDFIEMELVSGNIFMVYNMGQESIPLVAMDTKVNDGKYHVIKFVRSGENASLQVDREQAFKNPAGHKMTVFNSQARIMLGGRRESTGNISLPFHGTIYGVVFNGIRVLDQLKHGDLRVRKEGDVTLVQRQEQVRTPPQHVELPGVDIEGERGVQSTQGMKMKGILTSQRKRRSERQDNVARQRKNREKTSDMNEYYRYYYQKPNLVQTKIDIKYRKPNISNEIPKKSVEQSAPAPAMHTYPVIDNSAQYSVTNLPQGTPIPSIGPLLKSKHGIGRNIVDHTIGGKIEAIFSSGFPVDNDGTDFTGSGHPSVRLTTIPTRRFSKCKHLRKGKGMKGGKKKKFKFCNMRSIHTNAKPVTTSEMTKVQVGSFSRSPLAVDNRKVGKIVWGNKPHKKQNADQHSSSRKHSQLTTPRQAVTDDIIISGDGLECIDDDEDECITNNAGSEDDIITPSITITRLSTPKPNPVENNVNNTNNCKDCPQGTQIFPNTSGNTTDMNPVSPSVDGKTTKKNGPNAERSSNDTGHLNIFLIIGIVAGVLVAFIILAVALYRFRSRDEGTYRVDESQNFANLEAKKQQSNGGSVASVGNGKAGGKKRDVKEWYV